MGNDSLFLSTRYYICRESIKMMFFCSLFFLHFFSIPYDSRADEVTFALLPNVRDFSLIGFTRPVQKMAVAGEVSGKVETVTVDVGDIVPSTGLVAQLDSTFVDFDLAKNRIAQLQAQRELAQEDKNLSRYTSLIDKKSAAQATYDEVLLKADLLRLKLQGLKVEEKRLTSLAQRHKLNAPGGWTVIERSVEPGEYVHSGVQVMKVGDFRQLLVTYHLSYTQLEALNGLERLELELADSGRTIDGVVYRIAPDFDEITRKIPVDLVLKPHTIVEGSETILRGGLKVRMRMRMPGASETYLVPTTALLHRYGASWLITEDGERVRVILLDKLADGKTAMITGENLSLIKRYFEVAHSPGPIDGTTQK